MNPLETGLDANRRLLEQALGLLEALTLEQYAARRGAWAPVGAQYRHVLEHYQCFLDGVSSGAIDYDARRRDPELEQSPARAAHATRLVLEGLTALATVGPDRPIAVQLRSAVDVPEPEWSRSTVAREVQFLVSHTVHHFALIKLLLAGEPLALDPDFGVAPSTQAHVRAGR